jgi:hypothetical protein
MEYWSFGVLRVSPNCTPERGVGNALRTRLFSTPDQGVKTWLRSLTRRGGYVQFFPTEDLISESKSCNIFSISCIVALWVMTFPA